ncbi:DUF397 domain-containing protein [Thermomonospora umbrina]|uniref:Uncharacterized protein DUF397 n=1 Tax=Thermomonospora umbrina TaxID=111806 RepID=A0A3D9SUW1_9ACTN|nr:DUF397 domain-containing protein [Thermomonospora umbrina]REE95461.1 uncharacterized protein DUF397 [Thermomonospora umbrina]
MNPSSVLNGARWRKSTRSQAETQNCVELARVGGVIGVRDSKDPDGPHLAFSLKDVRAFIGGVRAADQPDA